MLETIAIWVGILSLLSIVFVPIFFALRLLFSRLLDHPPIHFEGIEDDEIHDDVAWPGRGQ